jgi:threonine/homoserine/homoserine lactone efflux protein
MGQEEEQTGPGPRNITVYAGATGYGRNSCVSGRVGLHLGLMIAIGWRVFVLALSRNDRGSDC